MTGDITLSVVVPTHNVAPWIREALESILAQYVAGMEVIVVDDHSTDATVGIVQGLAAEDDRLQLIVAESFGGGSARNTGVAAARGTYLVFADGDDIIPDGAYVALVESLEASGSDLAVGDYLKFSPTATWSPTARMDAFAQIGQRHRLTDLPTLIFSRPCWNKAFRRSFWLDSEISFPDVPRSNDIVPMTLAYVRATAIDIVPDVVYLYRDRPGATSMTAKAGSAVAFASYLTQESLCADLLLAIDDDDIRNRYRALIYDRDGFFHAGKFLAAWEADAEADANIVTLVAALLERIGQAPMWIDARKRATVQLLAQGEISAAAAAARTWSEGEAALGAGTELHSWADLLDAASRDDLRWLLDERGVSEGIARALRTAQLVNDEDVAGWLRLATETTRALPHIAGHIADLTAPAAAAQLRVAARPIVTSIQGGQFLRVAGTSLTRDDVTPALFYQGRRLVQPFRTSWGQAVDGGYRWHADFRLFSMPQGLKGTVVLAHPGGTLASAATRASIPDYQAWDGVLYEQTARDVTYMRRAHWVIRAPRRASIIVAERLRKAFRRGEPR